MQQLYKNQERKAAGRTIAQNSFQAKVKGDEIIPIPEVANGIYILMIEEDSGELLESIRLSVMK